MTNLRFHSCFKCIPQTLPERCHRILSCFQPACKSSLDRCFPLWSCLGLSSLWLSSLWLSSLWLSSLWLRCRFGLGGWLVSLRLSFGFRSRLALACCFGFGLGFWFTLTLWWFPLYGERRGWFSSSWPLQPSSRRLPSVELIKPLRTTHLQGNLLLKWKLWGVW